MLSVMERTDFPLCVPPNRTRNMHHVSCARRCVSVDSPLADIKHDTAGLCGAIKRIDFTSCEGSSAGDVDDKYYSKVFIYFFQELEVHGKVV